MNYWIQLGRLSGVDRSVEEKISVNMKTLSLGGSDVEGWIRSSPTVRAQHRTDLTGKTPCIIEGNKSSNIQIVCPVY